jgi:hypothetical protein
MASFLGEQLDFQRFEALNMSIQKLASAPAPSESLWYYDTALKAVGFYNGTAWIYWSLNPDTNNTANTLVRRGASGEFAAGVITTTKVTGLNDPTASSDAASKGYVDLLIQGIRKKFAVRAASTTNIATLSGVVTADGISLLADDKLLLKNQTTASQNGVWVVKAGAWVRDTDWATGASVGSYYIFIQEGTTLADSGWLCTNDTGNDIAGTAPLTFVQFSGAGQITAGAGLTKTGNQLDIAAGDFSITVNADSIIVAVDNSTIETAAGGIRVKDEGITAAKIAAAAIGTGLERVSGAVRVKDYTPVTGATVARIRTFTVSIGGGTAVCTHNFNTLDCEVEVSDATTGETVVITPTRAANSVSFTSSMPARNCKVRVVG